MLAHLSIRNFALIERMELELERGFVVVTGETGAGKSIVFDAVSLLIGARASADVIRSGEEQCSVQGVFALDKNVREHLDAILDEAGVPTGEELVVRRIVSRQGANRVFLNDTLTTVALLAKALDPLVEVVGQHEHLTLVRPETHRDLIDRFGGLGDLVRKVRAAHEQWASTRARLDALVRAREARAERIDLLRFQSSELESLELREGEMSSLEGTLLRVRNLEQLRVAAHAALDALVEADGSAVERIAEANDALARVEGKDADLDGLAVRLGDVASIASDVAAEARRCLRALEGSDEDIDALESRHEELKRAFRKYACDETEAIARLEAMREELAELEDYEDTLARAAEHEASARRDLERVADDLDAARRRGATSLFERVTELLERLGMPDAHLELAAAEPERRRLSTSGWDGVEILFSANTGEPPAPIGKVASGGELSRLLLAVKSVVASSDRLMTYTFDEVDTGIGGATAEVVGQMLSKLAGNGEARRQVLCVTHHPQIAAFADVHLRAAKSVAGGRTASTLSRLDDDARAEEVARMLGGAAVNEATRELARAMIGAGTARS
jgi:DNA repair protein RecN (Recombination protein N)